MAAQPYIPRADEAFRRFAEGFCGNISADPAAYMMTRAQADWLMRKCNEFKAAFAIAASPGTRTHPTITAKQDARSIIQNLISKHAAFIKINDGITDGDKLSIGVPPRNISRKRRRCPVGAPLLDYVGSTPGVDYLKYHSADTPDSPAKPYGAARLELWVAWSGPGEPAPGASEAKPIGSFTKSKMIVPQDREKLAMGLRPTYYARWAGSNDNKGANVSAWSLPASLAIASEEARKQAKAKNDSQAISGSDDQSLKLAA